MIISTSTTPAIIITITILYTQALKLTHVTYVAVISPSYDAYTAHLYKER